jgi:hypothetical protein
MKLYSLPPEQLPDSVGAPVQTGMILSVPQGKNIYFYTKQKCGI